MIKMRIKKYQKLIFKHKLKRLLRMIFLVKEDTKTNSILLIHFKQSTI
jgi:hypothetical protein